MTLKASIKADALTVFLNEDEFAESIIYRPRGGGTRTIKAIVDRDPPSYWSTGEVVSPSFRIQVKNSCTTGIASHELDTGGDFVNLRKKINAVEQSECSILRLVYQDEGMLEIDLR